MRVILILILIAISTLFLSCNKTIEDAKQNYLEKEVHINLLRDYVYKISPKDLNLFIQFPDDDKIAIKVSQKNYYDKNSWVKNSLFDKYGVFDVKEQLIKSPRVEEFLKLMNWKQQRLDSLFLLLKKADCYSIGKFAKKADLEHEYIIIGYPTNDLYGLAYHIYNAPLTKKEQQTFSDKCNFVIINEKVLIEYGGPAWGSNCLSKK